MPYMDEEPPIKHLSLPVPDVAPETPSAEVLDAVRRYAHDRQQRLGGRWEPDPHRVQAALQMGGLDAPLGQIAGALQQV